MSRKDILKQMSDETFGDQCEDNFSRVMATIREAEQESAYTDAASRLLASLIQHLTKNQILNEPELTEMLHKCGHDGNGLTPLNPR